MIKCRYCDREQSRFCMNSRDLEEFAIDGDDVCFAQLEKIGWGEKGREYIIQNRERVKKYRENEKKYG